MEQLNYKLNSLKTRGAVWFTAHAGSKRSDWTLALVAFLETIVFPIPIDPYLIALVVVRTREWLYLALLTTGASVLGAIVGYALSALFFDAVGARIIGWYGLESGFLTVQQGFADNVFWIVLTGAFTPLPFKVFVLTGGFLKVNIFYFILASIVGRGARYVTFAYITKVFGPSVAQVVNKYFTLVTIGLVVLTAVGALIYFNL